MPGPVVVGTTILGPLVTQTLQRVRDPGGLAHPRPTVVLIYSYAQRAINAILDLAYESVTITTTPKQQLYSMQVIAPNALQIQDVKQDGTRSLSRVPYKTLFYTDRQWHRRDSGSRIEVFSQLGVDLLVLHPGSDMPQSLTLTYTKMTTDLTLPPDALKDPETNVMDVPDDSLTLVKDLVEALLQLRERKFAESATAVIRIKEKLQQHKRFAEIQHA